MEANLTTKTVEQVVLETEEVVTMTMTRREAEVIRSVVYLAEFYWDGDRSDPEVQSIDDLYNIRYSLGAALGWPDSLFVVDTERPTRQETVYIKLR